MVARYVQRILLFPLAVCLNGLFHLKKCRERRREERLQRKLVELSEYWAEGGK